MSNFLYIRQEEEPLPTRYAVAIEDEAYRIDGAEEWQQLLSLLLYFLSLEEGEQNKEEQQRIREETWQQLATISAGDNYNPYNEEYRQTDNRSTGELILILLLLLLKTRYHSLPQNRCPRLFISHRRADGVYALRAAQLALAKGFAYWLDVLDPNLQSLAGSVYHPPLVSLLTACIIEMALINCTHVLVCLTPHSRGSLWIPYEYGRIKTLPAFSTNVAAWLHPNLAADHFPDYMLLGAIAHNETGIQQWLQQEHLLWQHARCTPQPDALLHQTADKLPEKSDDELEKERKAFNRWLAQGMPTVQDMPAPPRIRFGKKKRSG